MDWLKFLPYVGVAIVFLLLGMAFGQPHFISLEEAEKNTIIAKGERDCAKQLREIQKGFVEKVSALDDGFSRCFERNRELISEIEKLRFLIVGKAEDLNASITDLNCS